MDIQTVFVAALFLVALVVLRMLASLRSQTATLVALLGEAPAHAELLPMSSVDKKGDPILVKPGQTIEIVSRPQRVAFRPDRIMIGATGTPGGAADWIVKDFQIGNRSQFAQGGDVPGEIFACNAGAPDLTFETAQTAMDVALTVTYVGPIAEGVTFYGSVVGTAAHFMPTQRTFTRAQKRALKRALKHSNVTGSFTSMN